MNDTATHKDFFHYRFVVKYSDMTRKGYCTTSRIFIFILIVGLLSSCIYEPEAIFENPVNKEAAPPEITIINLDLTYDTVYVYGIHNVNFSFRSSDQTIQGVKLLIDNQVVDSAFSSSGVFKLDGYQLQGNEKKLILQVYTNSGTGSIADKLNAESYVFSNEWSLVIDKNTSDNTTYVVDNGVLRFVMEPYRAYDFDTYVIKRYWDNSEAVYTKYLTYLDYSYVGEGIGYYIYVRRKDGTTLPWGNISLPNELPDIHLRLTEDNKYQFWWNKSKYYNALDEYQYSLEYEKYQSTKDTFLTTDLKFGDYYHIYLYSVPKVKSKHYLANSRYYYQKNITKSVGEDVPIPWSMYSFNFTAKDVYSYINNDSIIHQKLSDGKIISKSRILEGESITSAVSKISPNAKFLLGYYNPGNNDMVYFAKNLITNQIYTLNNFKSLKGNTSQALAVSDIGTGVFANHSNKCEYLFDYTKDQQIRANCVSDYLSTTAKISSNGKYYIRFDLSKIKVYKPAETSGMVLLHNIDTWNSITRVCEFNPLNSNQFVISDYETISVYQCEPAVLTKKITLGSEEELVNIDFFSGEYLTYKPGMLTVKSFPESEVLFELEVSTKREYMLHNRMIIYKNGDYYMYRIK